MKLNEAKQILKKNGCLLEAEVPASTKVDVRVIKYEIEKLKDIQDAFITLGEKISKAKKPANCFVTKDDDDEFCLEVIINGERFNIYVNFTDDEYPYYVTTENAGKPADTENILDVIDELTAE